MASGQASEQVDDWKDVPASDSDWKDVKPTVAPAGPSLNEQLTAVQPWPKFDISHPVASAGKELATGLGNVGAGAISGTEGLAKFAGDALTDLPSLYQDIKGIPSSMLQMGKTAITGHPEYAIGQAIPSMAAGEVTSGVPRAIRSIPRIPDAVADTLREPATARQSQLGRPGNVKDILPHAMQRWTIPDWMIPKGAKGTPTNPGPFMEIPARMPKVAAPTPELGTPQNPGWVAPLPNKMPTVTPPTPELGSPENPGWVTRLPGRMPKTVAAKVPSGFTVTPPEPQAAIPKVGAPTPAEEFAARQAAAAPKPVVPPGLRVAPPEQQASIPRIGSPTPAQEFAARQATAPPTATGIPTIGQESSTGIPSLRGRLTPIIYESEQQANQVDALNARIKDEASKAGMYSAARGKVSKPLDYQERIGKRTQR